jgi:hypothetical protein
MLHQRRKAFSVRLLEATLYQFLTAFRAKEAVRNVSASVFSSVNPLNKRSNPNVKHSIIDFTGNAFSWRDV